MSVICDKCNKTFCRKQYLINHLRNVHKFDVNLTKKQSVICNFCNLPSRSHADLREHLISAHNIEIFKEVVNFKNKKKFISWKSEKEKTMRCMYVQNTGVKKLGTIKKTYYNCHRSLNCNHSNNEESRIAQRQLKSQGYSKLNFSCPSTLELIEEDGKLTGTLFSPHIGHDCTLAHIHLSAEEKIQIAGKIANGVSFNQILNEIQNSHTSPESLERIHLVDRQDLRNIKKQYGLDNQKDIKRGTSNRNNFINKSHKKSLQINNVVKIGNVWKVTLKNEQEHYVVKKCENSVCDNINCKSYCRNCNVCIHEYSCSCLDYFIKYNLCTHIHAVCAKHSCIDTDTSEIVSTQLLNDTAQLKSDSLKSKLNKVLRIINNNFFSDKVHNKGEEILNNLLVIYNTGKHKLSKQDSKEPNNKNVEEQLRFNDTKRKKNSNSMQYSVKKLCSEEKHFFNYLATKNDHDYL